MNGQYDHNKPNSKNNMKKNSAENSSANNSHNPYYQNHDVAPSKWAQNDEAWNGNVSECQRNSNKLNLNGMVERYMNTTNST